MVKSLYERSLEVLPPVAKRATKLGVTKGEGVYLTSEDGEQYLDFAAGVGVVNCGHNNPKVVAAVEKQLHELVHGGHNVVYYPSYVELAEKLVKRVGKDYKVYFSNSGAEANEGAVKLALSVTKRNGIIAFTSSFHGRTLLTAAMTASNAQYRKNYEGVLPPVYHVDFPDVYNSKLSVDAEVERCIAQLESLFHSVLAPSQVACIVVEPVQGEGGYLPAPKIFLEKLRAICDEHGILLIFDEIQSGYGRTGHLFAKDYYGVQPDVLTSAKGIANGIPLSAVIGKAEYMDQWEPGAHGGTFGGNPLACAAGNAVLDIMDDNFLGNVRKKGAYFREKLELLADKYDVISSVRGLGLMIGMEFRDPQTNKPDTELVAKIREEALNEHLILLNCGVFHNVIRFIPPLVVSSDIIDEALEIIDRSIARSITE
ncbi:aspartate aminotransferase family protein [Liquorilactobacillus mali]|uniref:aspartate aminotransferase family protein n=1 Tax=Liquorilactobacillus mali TaxID=1618 RepID=UPI0002492E97|nr:aminotransferase class III-fold pyridoxal phosphate-dependent enzyme [Liquorilactobacillus mali]EJE97387.1 4-aminobutyrate aminotransferase [Liquorilactobacillus mali KCTC 3596 = DSM 20444]MDC7953100.1 aminotransferase class III-fold pyridoxal phosphate-dependent enzyme [Liquorilactobacillus mali]QFQ75271.1 aminotransferase class III-fold pyridoxal phosphate-dependent enzyme [Liquorilactobacillus mali]